MPRSRWFHGLSAACTLVLAGCPFGSSGGDGDSGEPKVLDSAGGGGGGSGEGDGSGHGGSSGGAAGQAGSMMAGRGAGGSGSSTGGSGGTTSDVDGGTPIPMQVPLADLPDAFADAICRALADCVGPSKLRELTNREDCATAVGAELRAKDFAYMDEAIAAGHVLYDPAQLPACAEGIRALGCGVLTQTFPEPCVQVLEGNVAIDGECSITAECEGTAFCTSGASCPSTCKPLLGAGDACEDDGQCGDVLACVGGECAALSGDGEPCSGDSGKACALGLSCVGSTDTQVGSCKPNGEVQAGAADEACEPGGTLCQEGLSCVFDGASAFHCEAAVASGESCHLGLPGQCPVDEYCDTTEVTQAGSCRALPGDGEGCVLGDLCLGGHVCVAEGSTPTCRAIADNDEPCGSDAVCRSGHCVSGTCEPPPTCL